MVKKINNIHLNVVKFMSLVYNPLKYPIGKSKLQQISVGILHTDVSNDFSFFREFYYIKPKNQNSLFSVDSFFTSVDKSINKWRDSSYIWSLAVNYNNNVDDRNFLQKLQSLNKNKINKIRKFIFDEINKIQEKYFIKSQYDEYKFNLKEYKNDKNLISFYSSLYAYEHTRPFSDQIVRLLEILFFIDKNNWAKNIENLKSPFAKYLFNYNYYISSILKVDYKFKDDIYFYTKQVKNNSSNELIVFGCLNILENINFIYQKDFSKACKMLKALMSKLTTINDKYYWIGLFASNAEYMLHSDKHNQNLIKYYNKLVNKTIKKTLILSKNKIKDIDSLIDGLKQHRKNNYLKSFESYKTIDKFDHQLALLMAEKILNHYKELLKKDNFYLPLKDEQYREYTNLLIRTISFLAKNNRIDIFDLFLNLLESFPISKRILNENSSTIIMNKNKIIHIFTLSLFVLAHVKDKQYLNNNKNKFNIFIKKFLYYLGFFLNEFYDEELIISCDNIFKLNNIINDKLKKDILLRLSQKSEPPFDYISILISHIKKKDKNTIKVISLMENFFDKYNVFWENNNRRHKNKFNKWLNIWKRLKDHNRIKICEDKLIKK